jgi:hypothetical protein
MDLMLATLADYTMVSQEGKLSIIGIFGTIYARQFPATHRNLHLAMVVKCSYADVGTERDIQTHLVDADGRRLVGSRGTLTLPPDVDRPPTLNLVHVFEEVTFERPGQYSFNIYISGQEVSSLALEVVQAPEEPPLGIPLDHEASE